MFGVDMNESEELSKMFTNKMTINK